MSFSLFMIYVLLPYVILLKMFNMISLLIFMEIINLSSILMFNKLLFFNENYLPILIVVFALDSLMLILILISSLKFSSKDYSVLNLF